MQDMITYWYHIIIHYYWLLSIMSIKHACHELDPPEVGRVGRVLSSTVTSRKRHSTTCRMWVPDSSKVRCFWPTLLTNPTSAAHPTCKRQHIQMAKPPTRGHGTSGCVSAGPCRQCDVRRDNMQHMWVSEAQESRLLNQSGYRWWRACTATAA